MRTRVGTFRSGVYLLSAMALSIVLAACGGGGGSTTSSGTTPALLGPASIDVSIAAADVTGSAASAVAVAGSGTVPSMDKADLWPKDLDPMIAHVYMEVVKVSLMPAGEMFRDGDGDMDGEFRDVISTDPQDSPDKPGFVTIVPDSPIVIDLLRLENGKRLARFFNKFDAVPAGTYDKIRVYYRRVRVVLEDGSTVRFHPTANSKFDIHFRQGYELVIPATTDTTQRTDGWVKLFRVKIDVVGLKIKINSQGNSWKGSKAILRPQIFAEFVPPILYSVAGTAMNVPVPTLPVSGTFDVTFGAGPGLRIIPVAFNTGTTWAVSDNVLGHSSWIVNNIPDPMSHPIFRDRATVVAIGLFDTSPVPVLQARDIVFTFPDVKQGVVDNGWKSDNTFVLRLSTDNVVYPRPDRGSAYYDNVETRLPLTPEQAVDNNFLVKARGYNVPGPVPPRGIEAYWISWLGVAP